MKQLLLLFVMSLSIGLGAQDLSNTELTPAETSKFKSMLGKFSVTATAGTNNFATDNLGNFNLKNISLSQLTVAYKLNRRVSFGISTMSNLGVDGGYYNAENQFVSFCMDDDSDDDDDDMDDDDDDDDEIDDDDMDDDDCDDDDWEDLLGQNLMGTVTFTLSDKLPFFIQAAGGYSMSNNAPVYSAMIGYNQKLFGGLGIQGGVRFSEILYKVPADAVRTTTTTGLKAELGLSWNF